MFYLVKSPKLLKRIYPDCTWNITTDEKVLYLTFDDGPNPEATSFVLETLKRFDAKATFFCVGKNVKEHFSLYRRILDEGHKPGNHTFNHLNGWKTNDKQYLEDVLKAAKIIDSSLFRPPYGRITKFQLKALKGARLNLQPVMWDILSGDFDTSLKPEICYRNVINNAKAGSIIVFHDSLKALHTLQFTLPKVLAYYSEKGFQFKSLSKNDLQKIGPE